jgi:hypothetical protein
MTSKLKAYYRGYRLQLVLVAFGFGFTIYGLSAAPGRVWPNLLLDGFYVTSLAVSAIFFLATQRLTGARWSAALRRIPEAFMLLLPAAGCLLMLLFFGRHWIYPWSVPGLFDQGAALSAGGKTQYLRTTLVFSRMGITLLLWAIFAHLFRSASLEQDRKPGASLVCHQRLNRYSAIFVVVFALSFTIGSYDWLISMDPAWFTTMFAIYIFSGTFVQGIAAVTLAAVILREKDYLRHAVKKDHLHDLGKMLFAFSTFWAYIWVCQYLLIWYGNIPEEVTYYAKRTSGWWLLLFLANFGVNWIIPFTVLLSARVKSDPVALKGVAVLLLCGHWLDLYLVVMPSVWPAPKFGVYEISIAAGYAVLFYALFRRNLGKAPLIPLHDPVLALRDQTLAGYAASGAES